MQGRRFVIGDIHGAHKAFIDCLEGVDFDYDRDLLICVGDVCDGWPETKESIDEMLKMKNLVYLLGNHDKWGFEWFVRGAQPDIWTSQGGNATMHSYREGIPNAHVNFMKRAEYYHIMDNNKAFVHGGFDPSKEIYAQDPDIFLWDRSLLYEAIENNEKGNSKNLTSFDEVYVGHTPTIKLGVRKPVKFGEIWMMDTGAGWNTGVLTIMDIDSKEQFISNPVESYYPNWPGRG
jgi:serine/threonine protein phosphatase 1